MTITTHVLQFSGNQHLQAQIQNLRLREQSLLELKAENENSWWHYYNLFDEVKNQYDQTPTAALRNQLYQVATERDRHEQLAKQIAEHLTETQAKLQQFQPHIEAVTPPLPQAGI